MDITSFKALANEKTALQILTNKNQELVPGATLGGPVMDCCFYLKSPNTSCLFPKKKFHRNLYPAVQIIFTCNLS